MSSVYCAVVFFCLHLFGKILGDLGSESESESEFESKSQLVPNVQVFVSVRAQTHIIYPTRKK